MDAEKDPRRTSAQRGGLLMAILMAGQPKPRIYWMSGRWRCVTYTDGFRKTVVGVGRTPLEAYTAWEARRG